MQNSINTFFDSLQPVAQPKWHWQFQSAHANYEGYVNAPNTRSALKRALASENTKGRLYGDALGIPVSILERAPEDTNTPFNIEICGTRIIVCQLAEQTPAGTSMVTVADHVSAFLIS